MSGYPTLRNNAAIRALLWLGAVAMGLVVVMLAAEAVFTLTVGEHVVGGHAFMGALLGALLVPIGAAIGIDMVRLIAVRCHRPSAETIKPVNLFDFVSAVLTQLVRPPRAHL